MSLALTALLYQVLYTHAQGSHLIPLSAHSLGDLDLPATPRFVLLELMNFLMDLVEGFVDFPDSGFQSSQAHSDLLILWDTQL